MPRIIPVQPDADTGGRVAMSASVYQPHVRHGEVKGDGMDALAIVPMRTISGARTARSELRPRADFRISGNLRLVWSVERGRNVVLPSISLRLKVDTA